MDEVGRASREKRLDQMDRLADMGHFPALVNLGASVNVVGTLFVTWWLVPRYPQGYAPVIWIALVLGLNLLPVVLLRMRDRMTGEDNQERRRLGSMDFVRDQHRFSDWVYVAASANMAFWVLTGWAVFSIWHGAAVLAGAVSVAFLATFSPVLVRGR